MNHLTVHQFVETYIPRSTRIRIVESFETISDDIVFEGSIDELYYYNAALLNRIVAMVSAHDNIVCLICRTL